MALILTFILAAALTASGCTTVPPRSTATTPAGNEQHRLCQRLAVEECDRAIARAVTLSPELVESSLVLASSPGGEGAAAAGTEVLVAFAAPPIPDTEIWSTAVVHLSSSAGGRWDADYWRGDLPGDFRRLLEAAGFPLD